MNSNDIESNSMWIMELFLYLFITCEETLFTPLYNIISVLFLSSWVVERRWLGIGIIHLKREDS
jgi:hypothetical protein